MVVGAAALADVIAPSDPFRTVADPLQAPSRAHLMGTDNLGRDMLGAVVHGARTSMVVVLGVTAIASVLGLAVGIVAGYRGGWVDDLLMRITELFQSIPRFFLVLLVLALFGSGFHNMILVLGLTSWPTLARVVRAECLSLRERPFVEAARSLGAGNTRILVRHILPLSLGKVRSLRNLRIPLRIPWMSFRSRGKCPDPDVASRPSRCRFPSSRNMGG